MFNMKRYLHLRKNQYKSKKATKDYIAMNKAIVKEYPFLGSDREDYDYSYTELDFIPYGWLVGFGEKLLIELKDLLLKKNLLYKFKIFDIKEKYGLLRIDACDCDKEVYALLNRYENASGNYCIVCGKPVTKHMCYYGTCDTCDPYNAPDI